MKINLLLDNPAGVLHDHVNVDPMAAQADPMRVRCLPTNLEPIVDAGEATELLAMDILDYIPLKNANATVDHWISRLAHGGTIVLSGIDMMEVSKQLQNRVITVEQANVLLHGEQEKTWQFRQANYSLGLLVETLKAKGLRILKKRIAGFHAIVVAQRP